MVHQLSIPFDVIQSIKINRIHSNRFSVFRIWIHNCFSARAHITLLAWWIRCCQRLCIEIEVAFGKIHRLVDTKHGCIYLNAQTIEYLVHFVYIFFLFLFVPTSSLHRLLNNSRYLQVILHFLLSILIHNNKYNSLCDCHYTTYCCEYTYSSVRAHTHTQNI